MPIILAEELSATPDEITGALGRYGYHLRPKITRAQKVGRRNVGLFVPANQIQLALRDFGLRFASSTIAAPIASLTRDFFAPSETLYE